MTTLERLNNQLAEIESWSELLERLDDLEDEHYWAWEQAQELVREIEQDADLQAWDERLTPQERDASTLPSNYLYTHLVLMPFLRERFEQVDSNERELDESLLEATPPSALLWLATSLTLSASPTLEGQRILGWHVDEDELDEDDEDDDEDEDDELDDYDEDEDEDDDDDDDYDDDDYDDEQVLVLSVQGFYAHLNALCAFVPPLPLQNLSIHIDDHRADLAQPLTALAQLSLPALETLTLELNQANNSRLLELLTWSADQPNIETVELHLRALTDTLTLDKVATPKQVRIFYESHSDQRALHQLIASPLMTYVQELQLFEELSWTLEEAQQPSPQLVALLPTLAQHLPSTLRELFLGFNQDVQLDLRPLAARHDLTELKSLTINNASLVPGALAALLESPLTRALESLTLTEAKLRDEDAELLAQAAPQTLTHLALDRNMITQEGAVALATSPRLQALERFSMYGELLYVESVEQLYERLRDQATRSHEDRFGELRSLLQRPPTEALWEELCTILDVWPDMEQLEREIIPYVLSYTERWPTSICQLPVRWLLRAKEGIQAPMLTLVTDIDSAWTEDSDAAQTAHLIGNHPQLSHIKSLALHYTNFNTAVVSELAHSPNFKGLRALSLAEYWEDEEAAQILLSADLPALTQLSLNNNDYGIDEFLPLLLQAPYITQLTDLELIETELDHDSLGALIKTGLLRQLERLALIRCDLEHPAIKLIMSASAPQLKHLNIIGNWFDTKTLSAILTSELGAQLRALDFAHNSIEEGNAFTKLKDAKLQLTHLNLSCTSIPDRALKALGQCTWLQNIKVLDLSGNELSDSKGLKALIKSPHLSSLEQLILKGNYLSQDEYEQIHTMTTLPQVVRDQFHAELWDEDDYMEDIFE